MELSPKAHPSVKGSPEADRQEASQPSLALYNSSAHTGTNDRKRGALNAHRPKLERAKAEP